ncbi:FadR/GntR family transcriptional regulator [Microbacterium sp. GXF7504]
MASTSTVPASHAALVEELGRRIAGGALPAGTTMTASTLEREYGASRTVVRETVRVLEAHGLVASRRRVGIVVRPREEWDHLDANVIEWALDGPRRAEVLRDLTQLRAAVEPMAARLSAMHARDEDRAELLRLATRLRDLGSAGLGDGDDYLDADIAYHSLLLRSGGNALYARLASPIAEILRGRATRGLTPGIPHVGTLEAHLATAEAISRRDPDTAEASAREHLTLVSGEVGAA